MSESKPEETPAAEAEKGVVGKTLDGIKAGGKAVLDGGKVVLDHTKAAGKTVLDHTVLDMSPHGTNVDGAPRFDGKLAEDTAAGAKAVAQADKGTCHDRKQKNRYPLLARFRCFSFSFLIMTDPSFNPHQFAKLDSLDTIQQSSTCLVLETMGIMPCGRIDDT